MSSRTSTAMPVSSKASRATPSAGVSPMLKLPPGIAQRPSSARWIKRMRPPSSNSRRSAVGASRSWCAPRGDVPRRLLAVEKRAEWMARGVEHDADALGVAVRWLPGCLGAAGVDRGGDGRLEVVDLDLEVEHLRLLA